MIIYPFDIDLDAAWEKVDLHPEVKRLMNLKEIDLTNGRLLPDPNYYYFIDTDDPMGDIFTMSKPQGGRHEDIKLRKPKVFTISVKKKGTPTGSLTNNKVINFEQTFKDEE